MIVFRFWCLSLASIVAVALFLRWPQINESLWLDELHTSWTVSESWQEIYQRAEIGNHSPLYFYLPKLSISLAGLEETTLRLPSLVAGLALVIASGLLVQAWTASPTAGLFCAALIAIDPVCIFYSQEARPYACLILVACCHLGVITALADRNTMWLRAAFWIGGVLLVYLHYTAVLFLFAEVLFLFLVAVKRGPEAAYSWKQLISDLALVGLCCVPAALHVQSILDHSSAWKSFIPQPSIQEFFRQSRIHVSLTAPVTGVALAVVMKRWRRADFNKHLLLIVAVLVIPYSIATLASELNLAQLLFRRYLLPMYVAGIVCASLLWASISTSWLRWLVALVTIGNSLWCSGIVQNYSSHGRILFDRQQDWRGAVEYVNDHSDMNRDVAFVRGGFLEADQLMQPHSRLLDEYNLAPANNIYRLAIKSKAMPTSKLYWEDFLAASQFENAWFLFNGSAQGQEAFLTVVNKSFEIDFKRQFGDVMVILVRRVGPTSE